MELQKFQVADLGSGAVSHRDSVAGGYRRICRVQVYSSCTSRCQKYYPREYRHNAAGFAKNIQSHASWIIIPVYYCEIDSSMMFEYLNIGMFLTSSDECLFDLSSGIIGFVNDSILRMPPFSAQCNDFCTILIIVRKLDSPFL